jgi:mono/diheme cytochrome c family protein
MTSSEQDAYSDDEEGAFDPAPVLGLPAGERAKRMHERGQYLLSAVATCASCHQSTQGGLLAGGRRMEDRFGEVFAANITPDPETGIGNWGVGEISRAIRASIDRDGNPLSIDVHQGYRWMSDYDANSISVYLLSQAPMSNAVPRRQLGGFERRQWGVFTQHRDIVGYVPMPPEKLVPQYGQYLVSHVASCGRCHSPRDANEADEVFSGEEDRGDTNILIALQQLGGLFADSVAVSESDRLEIESMLSAEGAKIYRAKQSFAKSLDRAEERKVKAAPSLRSGGSSKLRDWSIDDYVSFLSTGKVDGEEVVSGDDCPWPHYARMAESDKRAIAMFLKRL